jgi:hypothetical protein
MTIEYCKKKGRERRRLTSGDRAKLGTLALMIAREDISEQRREGKSEHSIEVDWMRLQCVMIFVVLCVGRVVCVCVCVFLCGGGVVRV